MLSTNLYTTLSQNSPQTRPVYIRIGMNKFLTGSCRESIKISLPLFADRYDKRCWFQRFPSLKYAVSSIPV